MKCPRCQHENPASLKFCGECGARLASVCTACGVSSRMLKNSESAEGAWHSKKEKGGAYARRRSTDRGHV
ncbi:MAG: zinc ribbon domain-containing protein [Candidatus Rokubacteria bacterium]|nr:zinc ribbon domain-containing protein [Candidatus Rokubacteria bacterium]